MLKIIISIDYELFLGENNDSYENILIKPTKKLLDIFNENSIKATFFVDVCCLQKSLEIENNDFIGKVNNQLISIAKCGQDIQLHIHPNWLLSKYIEGHWFIEYDHYRIHSFGFNKEDDMSAISIIRNSKKYLEGIIQSVKPDYKCIAYRAGGYSIQPHNEVVSALLNNEIFIDSSICLNAFCESEANMYDYRVIPQKLNWTLDSEKAWNEYGRNGVYEVPLFCVKNNILDKFFNRKEYFALKKEPLKGKYIPLSKTNDNIKKDSLINKFLKYNKSYFLLSFDSIPAKRLYNSVVKIYKTYECSKNDAYVSIICHPKIVDQYELDSITNFINLIKKDERFDFCNMLDVYNKVIKKGEQND